MRPQVARVVDRLDDRDLLIERITSRFGACLGRENRAVLRRILDGFRLARLEQSRTSCLADKEQHDERAGSCRRAYCAQHVLVGDLRADSREPAAWMKLELEARARCGLGAFLLVGV